MSSPALFAQNSTTLTLETAMTMAAQNNTHAILAAEKSREARAVSLGASGGLLPQLAGKISQSRRTSNLAANGQLTASPLLLGPYDVFDARIAVVQNIFSVAAIEDYRVGRAELKKARLEEALARDQARFQAGYAYLSLLKAKASERGAESDVELARNFARLLRDQHVSGLATIVDVTRAAVQLSQAESNLLQAQTERQRAELSLKRLIVLPLDATVSLSDALVLPKNAVSSLTQAIDSGKLTRLELKVARAELQTKSLEHKAAWGDQLPALALGADYGFSGSRPERNRENTYNVGVALSIPIFNGLTTGEIGQTRSRKYQAAIVLKDTEIQIEEDVRLAYQNLTQARAQIGVAGKTLNLAQKELSLVQSQLKNGVGDSVALVAAEAGLTRAREEHILALAEYQVSRLSLAYAEGAIEKFQL